MTDIAARGMSLRILLILVTFDRKSNQKLRTRLENSIAFTIFFVRKKMQALFVVFQLTKRGFCLIHKKYSSRIGSLANARPNRRILIHLICSASPCRMVY